MAAAGRLIDDGGEFPSAAGPLEHQGDALHRLAQGEDVSVTVGHERGFGSLMTWHGDRQAGDLERCPAALCRVAGRGMFLGQERGPRGTGGHLIQWCEIVPGPHEVRFRQPVQRGRAFRGGVP